MYPTYLYRGEQIHSLSTMDIPVVKELIGELVLSKFEKIQPTGTQLSVNWHSLVCRIFLHFAKSPPKKQGFVKGLMKVRAGG